MPKTPNDMSMQVHQNGMCRIGPAIRASGMMPTQAIMPNYHPDVADRLTHRSPERDGDGEMGEGQPIGAVRQKRIRPGGLVESVRDSVQEGDMDVLHEQMGLVHQRERGHSC